MQSIPYVHTAAKLIFFLALALFGAVQLRVAGVGLLRRILQSGVRSARFDRGSLLVVAVTTGGGVAAAFLFASDVPGAAVTPGIPAIRWVLFALGIATIVAGSLVRQWAITTLGRYFTLDIRITDEQPVVAGGPYQWVRHPSYTADLVAFFGIALALGNWLSLLVLAVLPLLGLLLRIHVEEAALLAKLGEPYQRYAADKRRLVPGIW